MRFHYALVDDLVTEAEFEERVEAKAEQTRNDTSITKRKMQ